MIEGLVNLPDPENTNISDQEYFTMPRSISVAILVGEIMKTRGHAKSSNLRTVSLQDIWKQEDPLCLRRAKKIFVDAVTVAHPKLEHEVFLFTDASHSHFVTPIPKKIWI